MEINPKYFYKIISIVCLLIIPATVYTAGQTTSLVRSFRFEHMRSIIFASSTQYTTIGIRIPYSLALQTKNLQDFRIIKNIETEIPFVIDTGTSTQIETFYTPTDSTYSTGSSTSFTVDIGTSVFYHFAIQPSFVKTETIPLITIESSTDKNNWNTQTIQKYHSTSSTFIEYTPTKNRFLRITIPSEIVSMYANKLVHIKALPIYAFFEAPESSTTSYKVLYGSNSALSVKIKSSDLIHIDTNLYTEATLGIEEKNPTYVPLQAKKSNPEDILIKTYGELGIILLVAIGLLFIVIKVIRSEGTVEK